MTCHSLPVVAASTMQNSMYQRKSCSAVKAFGTQSFRSTAYTVRKAEQVSPIANWSQLRGHRSLVARPLHAAKRTHARSAKASSLDHYGEQAND
jgi:hypothetical protein